MGFQVCRADVEAVIGCVPGAVERVLWMVYGRLVGMGREGREGRENNKG